MQTQDIPNKVNLTQKILFIMLYHLKIWGTHLLKLETEFFLWLE